jgi:hypothetical protein
MNATLDFMVWLRLRGRGGWTVVFQTIVLTTYADADMPSRGEAGYQGEDSGAPHWRSGFFSGKSPERERRVGIVYARTREPEREFVEE